MGRGPGTVRNPRSLPSPPAATPPGLASGPSPETPVPWSAVQPGVGVFNTPQVIQTTAKAEKHWSAERGSMTRSPGFSTTDKLISEPRSQGPGVGRASAKAGMGAQALCGRD